MIHIHYKSCTSTQKILESLLESQEIDWENYLISAESQSQGVGQRVNQEQQNSWFSTSQSLAMSFCIPAHQPEYTLSSAKVAVLIVDYLKNKWGIRHLGVKWPNDIYRKDNLRKVGGILIQNVQSHLIIGIGLNLFHDPSLPIPPDLEHKLSIIGLENLHPLETSKELYLFIKDNWPKWNSAQIISYWQEHCIHLNKIIYDKSNSELGVFLGLGHIGQGLLENGQELFNGPIDYKKFDPDLVQK